MKTKMKILAAFAVLALLQTSVFLAVAGTHVWSGAVNGYWNVAGNWSSGGVPAAGEPNLVVRFPSTTGLYQSTNNISGLVVQRFEMVGNGYRIHGSGVTLASAPTGTNFTMGAGIGGYLFLPLTLPAGVYGAFVELNGTLIISSPINGPGGMDKYGRGLLRLNGDNGNTFTGGFRQKQGDVAVGKTLGVALPGPVTVGPSISGEPMDLIYEANHQIADAASLFIRGGETRVLLEGFSDTVGPIDFIGGTMITYKLGIGAFGYLQLNGDVTADIAGDGGLYSEPEISGRLSLGNAQRTITLADNRRLILSAFVDSTGPNGGITLARGVLQLASSNSFAGPLRIQSDSKVYAYDSYAFGSAAGPTILEGGDLFIGYGCFVPAEPMEVRTNTYITIAATNAWNGPIFIETNRTVNLSGSTFGGVDSLTLGGAISGGGRISYSINRVEFTGSAPNTLAGGHAFHGATVVVLAKSSSNALTGPITLGYGSNPSVYPTVNWNNGHQISDASRLTCTDFPPANTANGLLNLNGYQDVIGSIDAGASMGIACSFGKLTIGADGNDSRYLGTISGTGGNGTNLVKIGAGRLVLGGSHSVAGKTLVNGGTLVLSNAVNLGPIHVSNGARLAGQGSFGALTAGPSGILTPGLRLEPQSYGALLPSAFSPGGGYLGIELAGINPGSSYDQIVTAGNVNLNGVLLQLSALNLPHGSNSFTLVNTTSGTVTGSFIGLPEGTIFPSSDGKLFRITYHGGDGNDVVVTRHYTGPLGGRINGVTPLPDGRMQIGATGLQGLSYRVQASTTLLPESWIDLGSVEADAETGAIEFIDPSAMDFPHRFYRLFIQ